MSLVVLPELPLRAITSHLDFTSCLHLSSSSPALQHLQPRHQRVQGEDFSLSGPSDGDFTPETYFDVPVETGGLVRVAMAWEWKDQGYGNRKGQVWLQLVREGEVVEDSRELLSATAPHGLRGCLEGGRWRWRSTRW